ncbi:replication protein C (plasmid) [Sphingomonas paeninsulae]|jgi:replication initiation protein RepC|uniref:Replication protein C n=1 Tax=Sphingomonas paeninsulae TaxID=2319844 RepID=A0A494TFQ0_SPHPE|nr:plasmid replication protein RepC [Sphingomonas paeninsulae]AYJ84706.1 replication protein C [Sphingomonas paeninsulae]
MAFAQSPGRGLRRFDEHAAKATKLVEEFRGLETGLTPSNALAALKRAAPYMGVPLRVVSTIDLLFAWTKPQDWQGGRLPVVWPSNDLLAQKLGVTVRQVQKLLKQAQAFGLIGFIDSPNGHRGGRRGADGFIAWGYGIVLAPVGTRLQEFVACAAKGAAEDDALTVLRKRLAAARRRIRALAQTAFDTDLHYLKADDDVALALMATEQMRQVRDTVLLTACVEQIEARASCLAEAVAARIISETASFSDSHSSCWDDAEATHSTTTKQLQSAKAVISSGSAKNSSRNEDALPCQSKTPIDEDLKKHGVDPSFIMAIAPELCTGLLFRDGSWGEMVATAERLASQSGISNHAFEEACRVMGPNGAAASVIATIQKYRRGEVQRPGAYLRGMSSKAGKGELNLGRTLHGLKDTSHVIAMRGMSDGTDATPIGSLMSRLVNRGVSQR